MKPAFRNYLMSLLKLRHNHLDPETQQPSLTEALKCQKCGEQVIKAEAIYKQMRKEHPEEFVRKQEFIRSPELNKDYEMLIERVKKDKLYRRHIERLARGTEKEKDEEIKKSNEQYYQTHYEKDGRIEKVLPKKKDTIHKLIK